ncbi:MAG: hypothetical protein FWB99_12250 [Treponema sp.]|nr:hypothetical protein [Treponema sp.]
MWRLVAFILICAIFLAFVVLNLEHQSDVSFGFRTFYDIPVFLTSFASFVFGMLFAIPFVLSFGRKRKKAPPPHYPAAEDEKHVVQPKPQGGKKKKGASAGDGDRLEKGPQTPADELKKENSPYGVD